MSNSKTKVIIDTDPGNDDALALLMMLLSREIDVKLITTVAGNATIQNCTNNANFVRKLAGREDVPIASGSSKPLSKQQVLAVTHGSTGLAGVKVTERLNLDGRAVDEIIRVVRDSPNEVTLLVIGPQTNIAKAIQKSPESMMLVKQVVMMAGAFNVPGNQNAVAEFNVCTDPDAAKIVADFAAPKVYVPLDVCNTTQVPYEEFLRVNDIALRRNLRAMIKPYIRNINRFELPVEGALMYDVLAAYAILRPKLCLFREDFVQVETKGELTSGMTLVDRRETGKRKRNNAKIIERIPKEQFIDDFFAVLNTGDCLS